jgi:predicted metal-dependent hydrolase
MPEFEFIHNEHRFSYELQFARRKSIVLRVKPDLSLSIKAPIATSLSWIESLIVKKAQWIVDQQKALQQKQHLAAQSFQHGSTCYYLGQAYTLHIHSGPSKSIQIDCDNIIMQFPALVSAESFLKDWYKTQAKSLFSERLKYCYQSVQHLSLPFPKALRIKHLKSRWGSCSSSQKISLNIELMQYPLACIDYVIIHELCHLKEMNHGPRFYALMDQAMTDWELHRQTLRSLHKTMPSLAAL